MIKLKIRKGDTVLVLVGKDKGKQGKVVKVLPRESKILVAGINLVKKHTKPNKISEGGILLKEMPLHISNVAHIDPKFGGPTKVTWKILDDNNKVRIAKRSGEVIKSDQ